MDSDFQGAMKKTKDKRLDQQKSRRRERRLLPRLGPFAVAFAIICAIASFLIFAGMTPIEPTDETVSLLFMLDVTAVLILLGFVAYETLLLIRAWRAKTAAAGLHIRIVALFAVIAAVPTLSMAIVGSVTLDKMLNPAFMRDVRGFIMGATEAANLFREDQCRWLLQEAQLTASDLDRGKPMFDADRGLFKEFFTSRAHFLSFSTAALIKRDGAIVEQVESGAPRKGRAGSSGQAAGE